MKHLLVLLLTFSSITLSASESELEGKWYSCNRQDETSVLAQYFLIKDSTLTYSVFEHKEDNCTDVGKQRGVIHSTYEVTDNGEIQACEDSLDEENCQNFIFSLEDDVLSMEMNSENIILFFGNFERLD